MVLAKLGPLATFSGAWSNCWTCLGGSSLSPALDLGYPERLKRRVGVLDYREQQLTDKRWAEEVVLVGTHAVEDVRAL